MYIYQAFFSFFKHIRPYLLHIQKDPKLGNKECYRQLCVSSATRPSPVCAGGGGYWWLLAYSCWAMKPAKRSRYDVWTVLGFWNVWLLRFVYMTWCFFLVWVWHVLTRFDTFGNQGHPISLKVYRQLLISFDTFWHCLTCFDFFLSKKTCLKVPCQTVSNRVSVHIDPSCTVSNRVKLEPHGDQSPWKDKGVTCGIADLQSLSQVTMADGSDTKPHYDGQNIS